MAHVDVGTAVTAAGNLSATQHKPLEPLLTDAMDDALEVVEVVADSELEGAFVWLLRLLGLLAIVAGLGVWLFTDAGLLVFPALLMLVGIALLVAPNILLFLAELGV